MQQVEWSRIDVAGGVHLVAGRTGAGPLPIVALHGLTTDHHSFDLVAAALRHPDGMLAPDLRGRGESAKPLIGYGPHAHVGDVIRLLDQQGVERALFMGHSMGAYVALAMALEHPERVLGVVLLDGGWPRTALPMLDSNAGALMSGIGRALGRTVATSLPTYNAVQQDSWWIAATSPTARQLRAITCPVSLIRAGHGFAPASAPLIDEATVARMRACLPLVADVRLGGADHYTLVTAPAIAARVAAELDRLQRQVTTERGASQPRRAASGRALS